MQDFSVLHTRALNFNLNFQSEISRKFDIDPKIPAFCKKLGHVYARFFWFAYTCPKIFLKVLLSEVRVKVFVSFDNFFQKI